ncbi:LexA family protein [Herpetosiphon giganteus]|uniref:LexA family protein n=1 Tax=Herpetosiphon giganteus TaxID=2029754 RepID=UPI0019563591|nr:S24 family peptidase [Herpetosiphon giganteus]MBM7842173.1 SOS-response transcriptional repressor LexA [Herpetosiphon giganteus]
MGMSENGKSKDRLIKSLYIAEKHKHRLSVTSLSHKLGLSSSTISGHLSDLAKVDRNAGRLDPLVQETVKRGYWLLTEAGRYHARYLLGIREEDEANLLQGIPYRGLIAAGPAILVEEPENSYLQIDHLNPETHFALQVRGTSMIGYHICDGDIVIMRKVDLFDHVSDGQIVAVLVPEGTDVEVPDWHRRLESALNSSESAHIPALDHITLKQMDQQLNCLRGSQGTIKPPAMQIIGVMTELRRQSIK